MDVHALFIVLLMLPAAVKMADPSGEAQFWKSNVTLTCPKVGDWFDSSNKKIGTEQKKQYEFKYEDKGNYHCQYNTEEKYQFYVEGKACENCIELDAYVFLGVIIVDLVATVTVMLMVFKCTKRKDSTGPTQTSRAAPAPAGGRPPPVPASDYEQLNPHTRSHDTYSLVNRTG